MAVLAALTVIPAPGLLLMIGPGRNAEGSGVDPSRGYIHTAMAFSAGVEVLNMRSGKADTRHHSARRLRARALAAGRRV